MIPWGMLACYMFLGSLLRECVVRLRICANYRNENLPCLRRRLTTISKILKAYRLLLDILRGMR
jgi:hypothetical protein